MATETTCFCWYDTNEAYPGAEEGLWNLDHYCEGEFLRACWDNGDPGYLKVVEFCTPANYCAEWMAEEEANGAACVDGFPTLDTWCPAWCGCGEPWRGCTKPDWIKVSFTGITNCGEDACDYAGPPACEDWLNGNQFTLEGGCRYIFEGAGTREIWVDIVPGILGVMRARALSGEIPASKTCWIRRATDPASVFCAVNDDLVDNGSGCGGNTELCEADGGTMTLDDWGWN